MVDELRVRGLLDRMGAEIDGLRRLAGHGDAELRRDEDLLAAVKYRFIVALEVCIDLGRHVVASKGLRTPLDYADVFAVLHEADLLDAETAAQLSDTARFRNLLVRGYATVDDRRVVEILRTRLDDLMRFRTALGRAALG